MAVAASTVSIGLGFASLAFFALVVVVGLWAMRLQSRQFPKGRDRVGWEPQRGAAGRFLTMYTWLSGGRS